MKRIGGVIVSHGQVANELVAAAEAVVGDLSHITAVSIGWHDDVEMAKNEIARAIAKVSDGNGVLILTDMFGGTPTNISAMFLKANEVEIVTGANPSDRDGYCSRVTGPEIGGEIYGEEEVVAEQVQCVN